MKIIPKYAEDVIVGVIFNKEFHWYVTEYDYWFLDKVKRKNIFTSEGAIHNVDNHSNRFDIPVLNEETAATFLMKIKEYQVSVDELRHLLEKRVKEIVYADDILDLNPSFLVNFDTQEFFSCFPEMIFFENYVPDGWKGENRDFFPDIQEQYRYWEINGRDLLDYCYQTKMTLGDYWTWREKIVIYAQFTENTIRVYQAFNHTIADEALRLGTFGKSFSLTRMTWIKPSFLWMMYRSGWGTKKNQQRILAIDISHEGFEHILSNVVLTTYDSDIYYDKATWKHKLQASEVRCQFDPDRDINGNALSRRAIQLGLKGEMMQRYVHDWIVNITDFTPKVKAWREQIQKNEFNESVLPQETVYPVLESLKKKLNELDAE